MHQEPIKLSIKDTVFLFTDGAFSAKRKLGGWGYVAVWNKKQVAGWGGKDSKYEDEVTSNNKMELSAIKYGLAAVPISDYPLVLVSDSQYCLNALFKWADKWKKNNWHTAIGLPVKNKELIEEILEDLRQRRKARQRVFSRWVKGHSGVYLNELADTYATSGQRGAGEEVKMLKKIPIGYMESFEKALV